VAVSAATASTLGLAYLWSVRKDRCRDLAMSSGSGTPASARWVMAGVAQLVQSPSGRGFREDLRSPAVGQPGPTCGRIAVQCRGRPRRGRNGLGEEQRAAGASVDDLGQKAGGPGLEVQHVAVAALADGEGPFGGQVNVFDVEVEDLVGPRSSLEEQQPQAPVARAHVAPDTPLG